MALLGLVLCLAGIGGPGCRNLYRQTQSLYPADSCDRLKLRLQEARRAETRAAQTGASLGEQLTQGASAEAMDLAMDRFETAARDFARHVASVHDAAADCEDHARFNDELDRLDQQATQLLRRVQELQREQRAPADMEQGARDHGALLDNPQQPQNPASPRIDS